MYIYKTYITHMLLQKKNIFNLKRHYKLMILFIFHWKFRMVISSQISWLESTMSMLYKNNQSIQEEKIYISASYFYCENKNVWLHFSHFNLWCDILKWLKIKISYVVFWYLIKLFKEKTSLLHICHVVVPQLVNISFWEICLPERLWKEKKDRLII